jgi:uncharacterized integral membrane protein
MKIYSLSLLFILALVAVFSALNWGTFITPTEVSLGVTVATVPLGLVLLGFLVLITALFLAFVVYLQTSALLETRRYSRELQASRDLADKAEASRFTELRTALGEEQLAVVAKLEQVRVELQTSIEQSGNTLAAYIGELEDRLESKAPPTIGKS